MILVLLGLFVRMRGVEKKQLLKAPYAVKVVCLSAKSDVPSGNLKAVALTLHHRSANDDYSIMIGVCKVETCTLLRISRLGQIRLIDYALHIQNNLLYNLGLFFFRITLNMNTPVQ